ncbi:MAG: acetyltransferase [Anaerolineae bacterium]
MRRVLIVGAGGHGQVVADILLACMRRGANDVPVGFVDDANHLAGATILGLPVLGAVQELPRLACDAVIVAVGDNRTRSRLLVLMREWRVQLVNAVHPAATVAADVVVGLGVVICAGAVVGTGSSIGDGTILNTACSVDHHGRIGAFAHIAPGSHLGGGVTVGEGALVGIGSAVMPWQSIGSWAVVGAGSVVTKGVLPGASVAGVPARPIRPRARKT